MTPLPPPPAQDPAVTLCHDLTVLEDAIRAARLELDEVAGQIASLAPGVRMPPTLGVAADTATANLFRLENERDRVRSALADLDRKISPTVPVRVYTDH